MIKIIKKNYEFIFCIFILTLILLISLTPQKYISATYKGFYVWAKIVLPSLFCFFILTKLLQQNNATQKIFGKLDCFFKKLYKTKGPSSYIFLMSIISGYPMGAKLVNEFYKNGQISKIDAHKIISYSSTSGPMFILGSVAGAMLSNQKVGIIILISHILSSLLNGLLYRNYKLKRKELKKPKIFNTKIKLRNAKNYMFANSTRDVKLTVKFKRNYLFQKKINKQSLNEIMMDTITSVFMVGGFIALSFTLVEMLFSLKFFYPIEQILTFISPTFSTLAHGVLSGIIELTNGCLTISNIGLNEKIVSLVLSALISFGGLSIHLQSNVFLSKCKVKYKFFLLAKITHSILSIIISLFFTTILL